MSSQSPAVPPAALGHSDLLTVADRAVSVQVDDAYLPDVDAADIGRTAAAVLVLEGQPDGEVSVVLTSDETVAALNGQFRGVPEPTDVLSFSAREPTPGFVAPAEAAAYLGDVVIAVPFTCRQAAESGREPAGELRLMVVHGLLHLLGYDHADPPGEAAMWGRQDEILARLALSE
jgi:probable rRNA maturation factor